MKKMPRMGLFCALVLAPALALAQPKTPAEWYKEGETQYNLGNFDKAIEAFKKGFEMETADSKKSAYLYNIAQSYRMQGKDCAQAQFFYKRFLALRDSDPSKPLPPATRKDVEERIKELEECARNAEALKTRPPDSLKPDEPSSKPTGTTPPTTTGTKPAVAAKPDDGDGDGDGEGDGEGDGTVSASGELAPRRVLSARLTGGAAKINAGDLDIPLRATGALIAGYPIPVAPKLTIEVGAGFTFTPVAYNQMGESGTAQLYGVFANVGATYEVVPKLGLRADVGAGALVFSGASESPFTGGAETSGALTMFHLRVGASADYAITKNLLATVTPIAFSYSPAKSGLRDDIKSINALDFMIGLGYRM